MQMQTQSNIDSAENTAISKQLVLGNIQLPQDVLNYVYSFTFQDKEIYAIKKKISKIITDTFQNIARDCGIEGLYYPGHWAIYYNKIPSEEEMNNPDYMTTFNRDALIQLQGVSCMKCGNYIFHNIYDIINHDNKYLYCHCENEAEFVMNQYQIGR
jgi:hypothetical protein